MMTSDLVESYVQSQAKEFLRPKSPLERLQLIISLIWFVFAIFTDSSLQAALFFLIIILIILNSIQLLWQNTDEVRNFFGSIFRLSIFFWLFLIFRGQKLESPLVTNEIILNFIPYTFSTIYQLQAYSLSILLIIGFILRYLKFELLRSKNGSILKENYADFLFQASKGIALSSFLVIILMLIRWFPVIDEILIFPNFQDILLLTGVILSLLASQGPQGKGMQQILMRELFVISQNRFERLRDTSLSLGLLILALIYLTPILQPAANFFLIVGSIWNEIALFMFVFGLITFFLGIFESKDSEGKQTFTELSDSVTKAFSNFEMPNSFRSVKDSLKESTIDPQEQQFYKLTEDLPIINKSKTKFVAKENSVVIPVKDTPEGTAIVIIGESQLEQTDSKQQLNIKKVDGATTVIIPHDIWQNVYQKMEAIKPDNETIRSLALTGIETGENLITLAQNALSDFKQWKGPHALGDRLQGIAKDFQRGKYGVTESQDGKNIRLPGITVIKTPHASFVRVFGIKVLEIQNQHFISMPFLKVIDTPEYDFVKLPGITVIDTQGATLVKIMGFTVQEGDQKKIEETILKIEKDQKVLGKLMQEQTNSILDAPETLLLSRSTTGQKFELLTGTNEDSALINNIERERTWKKKGKKAERRKRRRQERRKIKPSSIETISDQSTPSSKSWIEEVKAGAADIQPGEIETITSPESPMNPLETVQKFQRILKVSKENSVIELSRLARQLGFSSTEALEDWILSLDVESLQVDWANEKLSINDKLKHDINELASRLKAE